MHSVLSISVLITLFTCIYEDLPYDIEIIKYGHNELEIKSGRSLSDAQIKLSKIYLCQKL